MEGAFYGFMLAVGFLCFIAPKIFGPTCPRWIAIVVLVGGSIIGYVIKSWLDEGEGTGEK